MGFNSGFKGLTTMPMLIKPTSYVGHYAGFIWIGIVTLCVCYTFQPFLRQSSGMPIQKKLITEVFFLLWRCDPTRVMASSFLRFLDHTKRRTTVGRTPLDEWSVRRTDHYLTTHNTHNRQTSMPPVGFEPTISAGERPQTYALDRAVTGTGVTKDTIKPNKI